jgi:hypothetical protein
VGTIQQKYISSLQFCWSLLSPNYALFIFNILTRTILLLTAATISSLLVTYLFIYYFQGFH